MIAASVDECYSLSDKDLREIYGADFIPEMTYIDHKRQKVIPFTFIKKLPPRKKSKISTH
jgi:hypothetical protein